MALGSSEEGVGEGIKGWDLLVDTGLDDGTKSVVTNFRYSFPLAENVTLGGLKVSSRQAALTMYAYSEN